MTLIALLLMVAIKTSAGSKQKIRRQSTKFADSIFSNVVLQLNDKNMLILMLFPSFDSNASNFSVHDAHMECSLKV